jgi:hypothetical protein
VHYFENCFYLLSLFFGKTFNTYFQGKTTAKNAEVLNKLSGFAEEKLLITQFAESLFLEI